ncbi:cysteine hydrolase family protein [Propionibacteriaceae bacterium Y1923]
MVVIDHQFVFADPASDWCAPGFAATIAPVRALAEHFGGRVVLTRWLPALDREGSWGPYFETFPFADQPDDDPLFALVESAQAIAGDGLDIGHTLDARTFGKYGADLLAITGPHPHLVLAGVSTDCCVLSTALAAVDDGATVTVAADACAGSSDDNHRNALAAMALYAPQLQVNSTQEIIRTPR